MIDAYVLNYIAFFVCCFLGYSLGNKIFLKTHNKLFSWAVGVAFFALSSFLAVLVIPPYPG